MTTQDKQKIDSPQTETYTDNATCATFTWRMNKPADWRDMYTEFEIETRNTNFDIQEVAVTHNGTVTTFTNPTHIKVRIGGEFERTGIYNWLTRWTRRWFALNETRWSPRTISDQTPFNAAVATNQIVNDRRRIMTIIRQYGTRLATIPQAKRACFLADLRDLATRGNPDPNINP